MAPLADAALVPSAVAHALGLKLGGEEMSADAIARSIGGRHVLLVLDNCEHLIDAAAKLAETIVRRCPRVTILATSRETFRIDGEYVYRVPPLEVPAAGQVETRHILGHSAVELFIARAQALESDFSFRAETLPAIAAICRRLDGIPLAIEFAAARAASLGIDNVAVHLKDRFALLTSGRRTAVPRHQTLRATLDWSYELLSASERLQLRRLAIFPAGFTIDAAAAVLGESGLDAPSVMEVIAGLVAKSLVVLDKPEETTRWFLLERTRCYALEKLIGQGEADDAARRHAAYFRDRFVSSAAGFLIARPRRGTDPPRARDRQRPRGARLVLRRRRRCGDRHRSHHRLRAGLDDSVADDRMLRALQARPAGPRGASVPGHLGADVAADCARQRAAGTPWGRRSERTRCCSRR